MLWLQLHSNRGTQEMASFIPWGNQFYTIIRTQLSFTFASILNTAINRKTQNIYAGFFTAALFIAMLVVTTNAFTF